jgi:hypothetical protein
MREKPARSSKKTPAEVDAEERDRATGDDAALVRYQQKWERKLTRLQQACPQRWRVPGLSVEEVRDALTLRLIEVVRAEPERHHPHGRADKEWGLVIAEQQLAVLRRRFGRPVLLIDFDDAPLLPRPPSQEELLLQAEDARERAVAERAAEGGLCDPQRRWLDALKDAANAGEFFASSDALNLSAASRRLGRHRSSAQRAYRELQAHFQCARNSSRES